MSQTESLFKRVVRRLRFASIVRRSYVAFLALCGVYAIVLLVSRFSGVVPEHWFQRLTEFPELTAGASIAEWAPYLALLAVPVGAAVLGLLFHRQPEAAEAARMVDQSRGTKDLFLTMANLERSPGAYKSLVAEDAESKAPGISADSVVPFNWEQRLMRAAAITVIVLVSLQWVPQLDPFGKVEAAEKIANRQKELQKSKKATKLRTATLKKLDNEDGELSKDVKKAIESLTQSFRSMDRGKKFSNLKRLSSNQKTLGGKWRKLSQEKLKDLLSKGALNQRFGKARDAKMQKWTRELQEGSAKSLLKELDEIKQDLKRLAAAKTPEEKEKIRNEIKQKMQALEEFAQEKIGSKPLAAAVKRALKQLESTKFEGLSPEASRALEKSMDLTKMELEQIAQSAKDLKALEESLQAIQMAKQLNEMDQLDGEMVAECETLEDYADLYAEMMAEEGEGTGGEGGGGGGVVDEDESQKTDFITEKSKTAIKAGKVLLTLKTKGLSDSGDAKKDYRGSIKQVKEGVSEAILKEQIPPGYEDGIRKYFDTLDKPNDKK